MMAEPYEAIKTITLSFENLIPQQNPKVYKNPMIIQDPDDYTTIKLLCKSEVATGRTYIRQQLYTLYQNNI